MKIVVLSHSCVVDVNQQLLQSLCAIRDTRILLISPSNWISDTTGKPITPQTLPDARFETVRSSVLFPGNVNLHCYPQFPAAAIAKFQPDLIYSTQEPFSLSNYQALLVAQRLNKPFVFHTNQNINKTYPPPFGWVESIAFAKADYALAYSQEAVDVMLRKGRARPSAVVPYATDVSRFGPNPAERAAVRQARGIAETDLVFGFLGRLVPEKGMADLLNATAHLFQNQPALKDRVRLLLVGTGSEADALQRLAESLQIADRVVFTGVVPHREASQYMNALDVFVLPSRTLPNWKEQFGRVIIEAMACHVPVIGSDSGEIPNLIRATQGGRIFAEGNIADLASKMQELAEHAVTRATLGRHGAEAVAAHYSLEAVASTLMHLFREAVRARSAPATG